MAHEFESGFFGGNVPAWHELGTVIPEQAVSIDRALELAGLDWQVELADILTEEVVIPGRKATIRRIPNGPNASLAEVRPLGVVTDRYVPVQNRELFEFGDAIVQAAGGAHWHTAGSLAGGRRVWGLIDLGSIAITPDEEIAQYVAVLGSHDGTSGVHALVTNVRIVCQNTWSWALQGAPRKVSIRHTGDVQSKLGEAQRVLGIVADRTAAEVAEAQELLSMPFSSKEFATMIDVLVPIDDDASDRSKTIAKKKREVLWQGYKQSDNLENVRTTRYGALQSIVETNDHILARSQSNPEARMMRVLDGTELVNEAHAYLLEA